jgi:hypothetical protein
VRPPNWLDLAGRRAAACQPSRIVRLKLENKNSKLDQKGKQPATKEKKEGQGPRTEDKSLIPVDRYRFGTSQA